MRQGKMIPRVLGPTTQLLYSYYIYYTIYYTPITPLFYYTHIILLYLYIPTIHPLLLTYPTISCMPVKLPYTVLYLFIIPYNPSIVAAAASIILRTQK